MPARNVEKLEIFELREQEDKAEREWLRAAAELGFGQLDRGEGIEFESMDASRGGAVRGAY